MQRQDSLDLLQLPDELVTRILALSGSKAICNAAATCTTLNKIKLFFSTIPLFSSTMVMSGTDVLETALNNAMEGMLGSIDFAIIALQGNAKQNELLPEIQKAGLPQSCQIVGGKSYHGSIGLIDGVIPWETKSDPPSVSVLLGRVPDRRVEAMACDGSGWSDDCDLVMLLKGGGLTEEYVQATKEKCAVVGGHTKAAFYGEINSIKTKGSPIALCFSPRNEKEEEKEGTVEREEKQQNKGTLQEKKTNGAEKEKEQGDFSPQVLGCIGAGLKENSPLYQGCSLRRGENIDDETLVLLQGGTTSDGQYLSEKVSYGMYVGLWRQKEGCSNVTVNEDCQPDVVVAVRGVDGNSVLGNSHTEQLQFDCEENLTGVLMEHTKQTTKKTARRELAKMFSRKSAAQPKHSEIYGVLEESAKCAKTGPNATVIFACCERGEKLFEEPNVECTIANEAGKGKMPIAGWFVGGEFGPDINGWTFATSETAKRYSSAGFTTMFAVL